MPAYTRVPSSAKATTVPETDISINKITPNFGAAALCTMAKFRRKSLQPLAQSSARFADLDHKQLKRNGKIANGIALAFMSLPKRSVTGNGNRNRYIQDLDARRKITTKNKKIQIQIIITTCLYLVAEPSYLLIIKRVIHPAASSAAGFLFVPPERAIAGRGLQRSARHRRRRKQDRLTGVARQDRPIHPLRPQIRIVNNRERSWPRPVGVAR